MDTQPSLDHFDAFEQALAAWLETVKVMRSFSGFGTRKAKRSTQNDIQQWIARLLEARGREVAAHDRLLAAIDRLSESQRK